MKKKIKNRLILISAIAIVITAIASMFLSYQTVKDQVFADLKAYAHAMEEFDFEGESVLEQFNPWEDELRITLVDANGDVVYESYANKDEMDNHSERPEIRNAVKAGEGRAVRWSNTASMHTFYYALQLDNGDVLRVGKDTDSIMNIMENTVLLILVVAIVIFIICAILARILTRRLIEPVEKMADNLVMVDEENVYEEIRPFVTTIKEQHINILKHSQMRQEFTANVSHELKTPLAAISGYAELIGNGMAGEEDTMRFANEIHRNADRLLTLINDIIKLSELDGSDPELEEESVNLYELAKNCADTMELQAKKNEVTIQVTGTDTVITANKSLMEELMFNLCSNAVRYNKQGGTVTVTTELRDGRGYLCVEDTGIGIPLEHQKRVFERFYRVDKSRSKSTGGTGLGLAIVKHIVAQHDAQLELQSEEDVGTKIEVFFK